MFVLTVNELHSHSVGLYGHVGSDVESRCAVHTATSPRCTVQSHELAKRFGLVVCRRRVVRAAYAAEDG